MKNISFILNQKTRAKSSIRAQVTISGCKYTYQTGISVPPSEFVNGKTKSKSLNMKLATIEAAIANTIVYFDRQFKTPAQDEFRDKVDLFLQGDNASTISRKDRDLFVFIDKYISDCGKSEETIKGYITVRNKLKDFFGDKDVSFDDIDLAFERKFKRWLADKDYSRNYIGTLVKNICVFMSVARDVNKLHANDDYKRFKIEQETADTIYLSTEELYKIHNLEITIELIKTYYSKSESSKFHCYERNVEKIQQSLIKAKNKFLIGAVCAMRISDYNRINTSNIKDGVISIMPKKGSSLRKPEPVKIPVHRIMREILDSGFDINEKMVEQNLNKQIKIVCKMAGIDEIVTHYITRGRELCEMKSFKYDLVSSHTARRSGATNMKLSGMPDAMIQLCTGHKTISQLHKYIKASYKLDNVKELLRYDYFSGNQDDSSAVLEYVAKVLKSGEEPRWLAEIRGEMKKL